MVNRAAPSCLGGWWIYRGIDRVTQHINPKSIHNASTNRSLEGGVGERSRALRPGRGLGAVLDAFWELLGPLGAIGWRLERSWSCLGRVLGATEASWNHCGGALGAV